MKRLLLFITIAVYAITGYASASNMSIQTKIFDANSQPPIVGGVIDEYSDGGVLKRGIIVSSTLDNTVYKESENWCDISWYFDLKDYRIIECTNIGNEQFWCSLKLLKSSCDYYIRAFVVMKDGTVSLGNIEKLQTKSFNRYDGTSDYANVWYAFSCTLFDLVTDEIINPNDGFYYSTNENPKRVSFQKGTSYNTCYKYATEWNYKLWYYHNTNHCDKNKIVNMPIMTYSNGKLTINKNSLDENESITIYYSINGNYFRPETYTDIYQQPISISSPSTVYCYAISSDGYISYTNMYVIGDINDNNSEPSSSDDNPTEDNDKYVEVCGIKWAKGNLQYDAVNGGNDSFQKNWRIAPSQWHFFHCNEGITSYEALKADKQVDHFTWGACGDWDYLHDITIYSTVSNSDINSKMYLDADCKTETTDYTSAKYGDIAFWASKGQYRMPTVDEINVLINEASYQYGYYVANDGIEIHGILFTTPQSSRIMNNQEIQFTDSDLNKGLFLPKAGGSSSNGTIINGLNNTGDSYWSSTVESYPQTIYIPSSGSPQRGKYNSYFGQWRTDLRLIRPVYVEDVNSEISIETKIFDANSQPMLVGGFIENYSDQNVIKKGIIVGKNADEMFIKNDTDFDIAELLLYIVGYKTDKPQNLRFIDCTNINKEQFGCTMQFLMPNTKYYVKAFAIDANNQVAYGETKELYTNNYNRYEGFNGYGNVWYAFDYTLFDLVTDEIINPNDGFYYSTNENPTNVRYQVGTSYNTCYKFKTEWNYKLWYYHSGHCDQSKILHAPMMSYKDGNLTIEKNPFDADKDITIYYSINGNYFRPENYTDVYNGPINITEPCAVNCYAMSSDGYISYTNIYVIGDYTIKYEDNNNSDFGTVAEVVDLGLSVKWSSWNLGASKIADYGGLYGAGDPTGLKTSTSYNDYHWVDGENICGTENDLAHVKWGDKWQLPTIEQLKELKEKCTWEHNVTIDNVKGSLATGPNGKTLFFPYAGARVGNSNSYLNKHASIWSGETGYAGSDYYSYSYKDIDINYDESATVRLDGCFCYYGQSIRPVYVERLNDDSNYISLNNYIEESVISIINNDGDYSINPVIRNIKKVYIDLSKGSTNSLYCYLGINNDKDTREICFSSKHLKSTSTDNFIIENNRYSIKELVDKKTFSWLYYNPYNSDEVIIDVKEYFGQVGYINKWQKNFETSCIVNIETDVFETSEDYISVSSPKTSSGDEFPIELNLENSTTDYTAYQFDIVLPAGISIATNNNGKYLVTKANRYEDEAQSLNVSTLGDNAYRIVCFSLSNDKIKGTSGAILEAVLSIADNVQSGTYEGTILNIIFTKSDGTQVRLKDAKISILVDNPIIGDTNGDKEVNVSDIVEMINYIMDNASANFAKTNADLNGDGDVNVSDIVIMVNIIMSSQYSATRIMSNRAGDLTDDDCLAVEHVSMNAGETKQVSINLNSPDKKYTAFQFDLTLPEGVTIAPNDKGKLIANLVTDRINDHTLNVSEMGNNTYRFLAFSMSNAEFYGTSGPLVNITLQANSNISSGTNVAALRSQVFTATDGSQYKWSDKSFCIQINVSENTEIDEIPVNNQNGGLVKVYTLTGLLLFSVPQNDFIEKWQHLPSGVYIVNGQKMIKSDDTK